MMEGSVRSPDCRWEARSLPLAVGWHSPIFLNMRNGTQDVIIYREIEREEGGEGTIHQHTHQRWISRDGPKRYNINNTGLMHVTKLQRGVTKTPVRHTRTNPPKCTRVQPPAGEDLKPKQRGPGGAGSSSCPIGRPTFIWASTTKHQHGGPKK